MASRGRPGCRRAGGRGGAPAAASTCRRASTATFAEQRIVEAAAVLPDFGGVTGWAASALGGGIWFDGSAPDGRARLPVTLATGYSDVRTPAGDRDLAGTARPARPHRHRRAARHTRRFGLICFEMRYAADKREAARRSSTWRRTRRPGLDRGDRCSMPRPSPAGPGIPQCRDALVLADENSWSPWETRMRLVWMLDAGFPRPLCNPPIFDRFGQHIGTPDLLDPEAGVVGEYDGRPAPRRQTERAMTGAGKQTFRRRRARVLHGDERDDSARSTAAPGWLRRARSAPVRSRRRAADWTLDLPTWWIADQHRRPTPGPERVPSASGCCAPPRGVSAVIAIVRDVWVAFGAAREPTQTSRTIGEDPSEDDLDEEVGDPVADRGGEAGHRGR